MKKYLTLLLLALAMVFTLAACGSDDTTKDEKKSTGEAQYGGTLNAAMFSAPGGQFNPIFYEDSYEANILDFTHEALVGLDEKLQFIPALAKEWKYNENQTELTYYLNEGVKWHDGEEFTADDVVFTYTAIADPDYTAAGGVRVDYVNQLVGYEDYVKGKTDKFLGVEKVSDYEVKFKFAESTITGLQYTSFPIIPEHIFKDVKVEDMPKHEASLNAGKVIGTGPFKFTKALDGEQYVLERFDDYWQAKPYLDKIVWKVVNQDVMLTQLKAEELHMVGLPGGINSADVEDVEALGNVTVVQDQDFGYQLLAFKLNYSKDDKKWNDPSTWTPNEKVSNKKVRQAIAHAINRQGFVDGLLFGSGTVLNAPFPEASWAYNPKAVNNYEFSEEKAKALLDEAGYKDTNNDGFREDPNGKEWSLNLDYPSGNKVREQTAPIIKENLEAVGIKVNLRSPREAAAHFELVTRNDTDWDMFLMGWGLSTGDPDPSGIHFSTAPYNYYRWNNAEADKLAKEALATPDAFDIDFRKQKYAEWAKVYNDDLPEIPLYSANVNVAFNKKFHGWTVKPRTVNTDSHLWWLEQ